MNAGVNDTSCDFVLHFGVCGDFGVDRKVFDDILVRDVVSWTGRVSGYEGRVVWLSCRFIFEDARGAKFSNVCQCPCGLWSNEVF